MPLYFFLIIFAVASTAYIAMIRRLPFPGDFVLKALPIWVLATISFMGIPGIWGPLMGFGFLLSSVGDVSLAFSDRNKHQGNKDAAEKLFIVGLGSFLLAHVVYVVAFAWIGVFDWSRWWLLILLAGYAIGMVVVLSPKLGEMRIPVFLYIAVIAAMAFFATITIMPRPWVLISGAILFMLSDSMIAIDKFLSPYPWSKYFIMTTYYGGQFLMCMAFFP
ncbi:MAG: lysoplasmalogenase, partial [Bacteroidota bacterium]